MKVLTTEWGPELIYDGVFIRVEDINPYIVRNWRLSRWQVFKFGARTMAAAVFAKAGA